MHACIHTYIQIHTSNIRIHTNTYKYPETLVATTLTEIAFEERKSALQRKRNQNTRILPFVTQYRPSVPNLNQKLMQNWHLIQQQPLAQQDTQRSPYRLVQKGHILKRYTRSSKTLNRLLHVNGSCVGLSPPLLLQYTT